jgi:putative aldouronate transport system substrate-binding protein
MCEYPEAAFRLIDCLTLEENTLSSVYGPKEQGWRAAVAKEYDYDGEDARITVLEGAPANSALGWNMGIVMTPAMAAAHTAPWRPYKPGVPSLVGCEVIIYRASAAHREAAQPVETVLPELWYTTEEYEELLELEKSLRACTDAALEAFVTGAWDVDADWTRHLTLLENAGLGQYLKLIKAAYDRTYR